MWRSNSHPCLLAHLRSSLRHSLTSFAFPTLSCFLSRLYTLFFLTLWSHASALSSYFSPSSSSSFSPLHLSSPSFCPSSTPLLCSFIALLVSHHYCLSFPFPSSFRHISLGAIHPANTFYGLNPFSHCVFTGLGAGIDLPLFVSPITRFLSLACCSVAYSL